MKDWETILADWNRRLTAWNEVYDREFRGLIRKQRGLFRRPDAEALEAAADEARRHAGEDTMVELFGTFDELCREYLEAELPQHHAKLRAWVGMNPEPFEALWSYVEQAPELIRNADDVERLELALAAVSLDDGRVDANQRDAALGKLYLAARRAGIDPVPAFEKVAAVSNPGTGGGGAETRRVLEHFDRSLHFEQHVRRRLSRAG